ncbi:MAG: methyltransferase domain-containing protein [Bryobacterales bacterium]|nr:methyltransferase domain-containing protein [Bryobacterales bacterium]
MSSAEITARMREDWNARAREDAGYYVAFGQRDQDDAGFFATAIDVLRALETELRRIPPSQCAEGKALEIGCGPGRLMRPMSRYFREIHGVDVSDEMIALAREKLRDVPNAFPRVSSGAGLEELADDSFDFVYSYAVFQHIPSREVVYQYMREIRRVLKMGGLARLQFNGLMPETIPQSAYNTWAGARFSAAEILEFTKANDFQVYVLEGVATQYMSTTWHKQPGGWQERQRRWYPAEPAKIRRITNASSTEPLAPGAGPFASISILAENLPDEVGLHHFGVAVGGSFGTVTSIGALDPTGFQEVKVLLPEGTPAGLIPLELRWLDRRLCAPATLRVIPAGPLVPRIESITDGVNLISKNRIENRLVKITLEEIARPDEIRAFVDGLRALELAYFCVDPRRRRYEVNFRLPDSVGSGNCAIEVFIGKRKLAPVSVEVVASAY